jgi:hypothetical protein
VLGGARVLSSRTGGGVGAYSASARPGSTWLVLEGRCHWMRWMTL